MLNIEIHDYEDDKECVVYPYGFKPDANFVLLRDIDQTITFFINEKVTWTRPLHKPRGEWTIEELRELCR
jgi:hypothetical protein